LHRDGGASGNRSRDGNFAEAREAGTRGETIEPRSICEEASGILEKMLGQQVFYSPTFNADGVRDNCCENFLRYDQGRLTTLCYTAEYRRVGVILAATPRASEFPLFLPEDLRNMSIESLGRLFLERPMRALEAQIRTIQKEFRGFETESAAIVTTDLPLPQGLIDSVRTRRLDGGLSIRMVSATDTSRCPTRARFQRELGKNLFSVHDGYTPAYDVHTDSIDWIPNEEMRRAMLFRFDVAFALVPKSFLNDFPMRFLPHSNGALAYL
jgi:hypothetical protein